MHCFWIILLHFLKTIVFKLKALEKLNFSENGLMLQYICTHVYKQLDILDIITIDTRGFVIYI